MTAPLRERGLRLTPLRKVIAHFLEHRGGHPDAPEVLLRLHIRRGEVSVSFRFR